MAKAKQKESVMIDCTINWAHLAEVNDMSGKYQLVASQLSDADVTALQGIGLGPSLKAEDHKAIVKKWKLEGKLTADEIKEKAANLPDRGTYMIAKSEPKKEQYQNFEGDVRWFTITDSNRNELDASTIGNGSKAMIKIEAVPYTGYGGGNAVGLSTVIVYDLVKYAGAGDKDADMYAAAALRAKAAATKALDAEASEAGSEEEFDYSQED